MDNSTTGRMENFNSQRPRGPIILKKGVDRFANIYQGWNLSSKRIKMCYKGSSQRREGGRNGTDINLTNKLKNIL